MKFNVAFEVSISVNIFTNNTEDENYQKESKSALLKLQLSKEDASNIIFRWSKNIFRLSSGNIIQFKTNDNGDIIAISIHTEDEIWLIKNTNQFLADVSEGYFRIRCTEKISNIMEFDFESAMNNDED